MSDQPEVTEATLVGSWEPKPLTDEPSKANMQLALFDADGNFVDLIQKLSNLSALDTWAQANLPPIVQRLQAIESRLDELEGN